MSTNDSTQFQSLDASVSASIAPRDAAARQAAEAQVAQAWNVGDVILDLYEVISLLGEGGMGKVYKVHHRGWNTDLAVKSPKPEILIQAGGAENFTRECETWVNLGLYPHIVSCYYVRTLGDIPRVFAEYVAGGSLKDWIDTRKLYEGGPDNGLERMLDVAIQFAWGLHYAHEAGLVHQDVKPANVMMTPEGMAKVTDFGLAKARGMAGGASVAAGQSILVSTGGMTPAYCSPEQAQHQPLTRRTDIWSWGVSILEMFAGEVTWLAGQAAAEALAGYLENGPEDKAIPAMPSELADLLGQCFQKETEARPNDLQEIAAALQQIYAQVTGRVYARLVPQASELQADGLNNKALSLHDLGRMAEAEALWTSNHQANPGHLETAYNLGLVLWRVGQKTDIEMLKDLQAAAASPDDWRLGWLASQVHLERRDLEALALLETLPPAAAAHPEVAVVRRQAEELEHLRSRLSWTLTGAMGSVNSVCLSQDGRYALTGSDDKVLNLWEIKTGQNVRTFAGHTDVVQSVCLSGDGHYALSGSTDGTLKLWEVATGKCMRTFEGHTHSVNSVCLSGDGRYAVSGSGDNTLKLWEVATGRCVRTFVGHTHGLLSVCLSVDGRHALSGSADNTLKLWEVATGKCVRMFEGHTDMVPCVCLSADGRYVLSASKDKTLKLWDSASGECVRTLTGHMNYVETVFMSADGRYALSGDWDETLKLWEVATGRCLRTFAVSGTHDMLLSVCLSTDGWNALVGSWAGTLQLWEVGAEYRAPFVISRIVTNETAATAERLLDEAQAARQRGEVAAEADALRRARSVPGYEHNTEIKEAWSRLYRRMRRVSLRTGWLVRTFAGHADSVLSVYLSQDGQYALSGTGDMYPYSKSAANYRLKLWKVATGACVRTFEGHTFLVKSVCLSGDGWYALSASDDHTLKLWNVATGACVRTFEGHKGDVNAVCLSADGRYALSAGDDNTLKLWDISAALNAGVATGQCLRTFEGHTSLVMAVCLSADEGYALSGSADNTLKLWEVATGKCVRTFEGQTGPAPVYSVCLSGDGRFALSGSFDKTLKLWDVATGECVRTFEGHMQRVLTVCMSGDGRYALSGSSDKTLKLWDLEAGACVRTLEGHTGEVNAVRLTADGRYALSGSSDKTLKLWELDWELEDHEPAEWDEGARPYLQNFLALHRPYAGQLAQGRSPTDEEVTQALSRRGQPEWNAEDFQQLLGTLGCAGYGWLRPEGVRRELERMAKKWKGPLSLKELTPAAPEKVISTLIAKPSAPQAKISVPPPEKIPSVASKLPDASNNKASWLSRLFGKKKNL